MSSGDYDPYAFTPKNGDGDGRPPPARRQAQAAPKPAAPSSYTPPPPVAATVVDKSATRPSSRNMDISSDAPSSRRVAFADEVMASSASMFAAAPIKPAFVHGEDDPDEEISVPVPRAGTEGGPCTTLSVLFNRVIPKGGMFASAITLASCTLGASITSLPMAFKLCGITVAIVLLVAVMMSTVYSIHLLMEVKRKTKLQSYEEMAKYLLGYKTDYLVSANMFAICFGACVAYIISMCNVLKAFSHQGDDIPLPGGVKIPVCIIWFFVLFPMSLPKEINTLRYTSTIGVCAICYFVLAIVIHSAMNGLPESDAKGLSWGNFSDDAVIGLSLIMFAYLCQTNVFEVSAEMQHGTVKRVVSASGLSMGGCLVLYIIAGFFGYADFGRVVQGAVLLNYDAREDINISIAFAMLIVKLCAAFALAIHPARDAAFYVLGWGNYLSVPRGKRLILCTIMSLAALALGLYIPSIEVVFGLLGSVCGGLLGFIFPALFIMYAGDWSLESVGVGHYIATMVLLFGGVLCMVFGTLASIYGLIVD